MRVWVFQTGEFLPYLEPGHRPMRAANLTATLEARGHTVTLWTADFNHYTKRHRFGRDTLYHATPTCEIRLIHSPGYTAHVGVGRLTDHAILACRLATRLRHETPPDVAVVGYPPIETASVLVHWLQERGVPVFLDVKDQWPETYLRPVPAKLRVAGRALLAPYSHWGRRAMREATGLVSISEPFLRWAIEWSGRESGPHDHVAYLTPQLQELTSEQLREAATWWDDLGVKREGLPRATYVGSLSGILDLEPIFDAAEQRPDWQFVLAGHGPLHESLVAVSDRRTNIVVPGWIDAARARVLYQRSTAALIPYRPEAAFLLSIPNKTFDALGAGVPILTSLGGELGDLISRERVGFRYGRGSASLESRLAAIATDDSLRESLSAQARQLYECQYSFEKVYGDLCSKIESAVTDGIGDA